MIYSIVHYITLKLHWYYFFNFRLQLCVIKQTNIGQTNCSLCGLSTIPHCLEWYKLILCTCLPTLAMRYLVHTHAPYKIWPAENDETRLQFLSLLPRANQPSKPPVLGLSHLWHCLRNPFPSISFTRQQWTFLSRSRDACVCSLQWQQLRHMWCVRMFFLHHWLHQRQERSLHRYINRLVILSDLFANKRVILHFFFPV